MKTGWIIFIIIAVLLAIGIPLGIFTRHRILLQSYLDAVNMRYAQCTRSWRVSTARYIRDHYPYILSDSSDPEWTHIDTRSSACIVNNDES